jgi:hypothetical protein
MSHGFTYSRKARPRRPKAQRQCPVCEQLRSGRSFIRGKAACYGCRREKRPKRGCYTPSGKLTPTQREQYAAQAEAERARAVIADARAAQGLPVLHGCTPLARGPALSDRGLHVQLRATP